MESSRADVASGRAFPLLIVTGMSGAGKSTALNVLEDLGFFSVDGLPASLAAKLVSLFVGRNKPSFRGLALGMDLRQKEFLATWDAMFEELKALGVTPEVLFVDAKTEVLVRRYAATRRPHPLARQGERDLGLEEAIEAERSFLSPLRHRVDVLIDTSAFSIHDLRRAIQDKWSLHGDTAHSMRVRLITFGFKYGVPAEADMVFDLRFLPNPYFVEKLRPLSGKDEVISRFVLGDEPGKGFFLRLMDFVAYLLPLYQAEGRHGLIIAIGCTGGRHRSVAVAEAALVAIRKMEYEVSLEHRHLELG